MILQKWQVNLDNYPTEVKVSESRRASYWSKGDTIPKKYKNDPVRFTFNKEDILIDNTTGDKVIANPLVAGTPRMLPINAQKIYVGIHHAVRSLVVNKLHSLFHDAFKAQLPKVIDLDGNRILIGLHFHDVYHFRLPDLDNLAGLFAKCGIDCLTSETNKKQSHPHKLGILPDDKMIFIPHIFYEFTPVDDVAKRKLDFNLYLVEPGFSIEALLDQELLARELAIKLFTSDPNETSKPL